MCHLVSKKALNDRPLCWTQRFQFFRDEPCFGMYVTGFNPDRPTIASFQGFQRPALRLGDLGQG